MSKLESLEEPQLELDFGFLPENLRHFSRIVFLSCPTGAFCREDRCQSFFDPDLVPSMRPPLEECEAGGAITASGAKYLVIDAPALKADENQVMKILVDFKPDLIVLSVTFGSLELDLEWAKKLHSRFHDIPIGLRGAPCYASGAEILKQNTAVTFCLRGDYELIFRSIVANGLERAVGVLYKNFESKIVDGGSAFVDNLDALPIPDRSGINPKLYKVRGIGLPQATIRVQRGCPFPCTYCLVHSVSGKKARHRSPESIVSEMQKLCAEGVNFFYLRAETFSLDRDWALALVRLISLHCPSVRWVTTTRVEHVDDHLLREMKAAGCYGISFGLDVASGEISRQVKKPLRLKEAQAAMSLCDRHGIISLAYIMVGFVWETEASLEETSKFIRSIRPDLLTIHYAHPYPGTVYYQQVLSQGAKIVSLKAQSEPALALDTLTPARVKNFGKTQLSRHYRRPAVLISLLRKFTPIILRAIPKVPRRYLGKG